MGQKSNYLTQYITHLERQLDFSLNWNIMLLYLDIQVSKIKATLYKNWISFQIFILVAMEFHNDRIYVSYSSSKNNSVGLPCCIEC